MWVNVHLEMEESFIACCEVGLERSDAIFRRNDPDVFAEQTCSQIAAADPLVSCTGTDVTDLQG